VRIVLIAQDLNVKSGALRCRSAGRVDEMTAKMLCRDVGQGTELDLDADDLSRVPRSDNGFDLAHQVANKRKLVHNSVISDRSSALLITDILKDALGYLLSSISYFVG